MSEERCGGSGKISRPPLNGEILPEGAVTFPVGSRRHGWIVKPCPGCPDCKQGEAASEERCDTFDDIDCNSPTEADE